MDYSDYYYLYDGFAGSSLEWRFAFTAFLTYSIYSTTLYKKVHLSKRIPVFICLLNLKDNMQRTVVITKSLGPLNSRSLSSCRPGASEVLTAYLLQCNEPPWTSYFVKYSSVKDDQFGMSNFNWKVGKSNYQILRTGCFPYIKYHCSKRQEENLESGDKLMRVIKVVNLGIPCLLYGLAATQLIKHQEVVKTSHGPVTIYFLLPEHKGSQF